jgi:hypothetical protein
MLMAIAMQQAVSSTQQIVSTVLQQIDRAGAVLKCSKWQMVQH